jgi:hypothetical protein
LLLFVVARKANIFFYFADSVVLFCSGINDSFCTLYDNFGDSLGLVVVEVFLQARSCKKISVYYPFHLQVTVVSLLDASDAVTQAADLQDGQCTSGM